MDAATSCSGAPTTRVTHLTDAGCVARLLGELRVPGTEPGCLRAAIQALSAACKELDGGQ
jgi:hypothetical protein